MIVPREQLSAVLQPHRHRGDRIIFTNGCFDLVHAGHLTYLRTARSLGDCLVVGLNSDDSVQRLKGKGRPILPQQDRALLLDALQFVDYVVIFEEDTPESLIREVRPHLLVKGGDYRPWEIVGARFVTAYGGHVAILPYIAGKSTTAIVAQICATLCRTKGQEQ